MNSRYRAAHAWAALLIDAGGPDDILLPGPWRAGSLLFDMNRLWERAVARLCDEINTTLPSHRRAITVQETGRPRRSLRPDAAVDLSGVTIPIDAKYKAYGTKPIEPSDTHQLLTYAAAYALPTRSAPLVAVVYPSPMPTTRTAVVTVNGHHPLGTIALIGLSPVAGPEDARDHLAAGLRQAATCHALGG
jgi:5-methylcytosine-specific restriction enzyme subunit McrC